jgi:hypothetical protein
MTTGSRGPAHLLASAHGVSIAAAAGWRPHSVSVPWLRHGKWRESNRFRDEPCGVGRSRSVAGPEPTWEVKGALRTEVVIHDRE